MGPGRSCAALLVAMITHVGLLEAQEPFLDLKMIKILLSLPVP